MKILMINDYGYKVGGVESHLFDLVRELKKKGHDVRLFTSYSKRNLKFVNFSAKTYKIPMLLNLFSPLHYFNIFSYFKLKNAIKEFKPDILHYHNVLYELSPSVYKLSKKIHSLSKIADYYLICPKVTMMTNKNKMCDKYFSYHCLKSKCISRKSNLIRYFFESIRMHFIKKYVKNIRILTTPSYFVGKVISRLYNNKLETLNNFVEMQKLRNYTVQSNLLYVGRLAKIKGVQNLILAYSKLKPKFRNRKLIIVGDGEYREQLEKLTKSLNLEKNVIFCGKKENLEEYYRKASLVVVPSIWPEPFGIVIIEAMSYGVPVIASNVGGIPEIIKDSFNGYLFKHDSVSDLTKKLELF